MLVRMGFVPYFLFRKKQFVNLRFITWNNLVEMFWLFLDVFNFFLLEMNGWIRKDCAWVEAFLVMLFENNCVFLRGKDKGGNFRFKARFQLPKQGNHSSGKGETSPMCLEMAFTQARGVDAVEMKAEGSFLTRSIWDRSVYSFISVWFIWKRESASDNYSSWSWNLFEAEKRRYLWASFM